MRNIELLAPAGNREKMETVFHYGADAAYFGLQKFNLRKFADNFADDEIHEAVRFAHGLGKRLYATLNIIPFESDLAELPAAVRLLDSAGVDGVIVSDLGVLDVVKEHSRLPVHVSTQASNTNWRSVRQWHRLGAKRVVLAREVPIDDIKRIKDAVPEIEIEVFVHGAMCMAFSGHCFLSAHLAGRDANSGGCAQSCRWKYALVEQNRPGEYIPIEETERGTYVFNARDLCTVEFLDKLLDAGVDSLKIEGRVKGIHYAATTTKIYKEALRRWQQGSFAVDEKWITELMTVSNRGFTSGFFLGKPTVRDLNTTETQYYFTHVLAAKVEQDLGNNEYVLWARSPFHRNLPTEWIPVDAPVCDVSFESFLNHETGEVMDLAHPNYRVRAKCSQALGVGDLLRQPSPDKEKVWNPKVQQWARDQAWRDKEWKK
jgi:putative protease